jgi:DNA modification methylase
MLINSELEKYIYYKTEKGILLCGDNTKLLPLINHADFCFTDPPYNVGKDYGVYKDNLSEEAYKDSMNFIFSKLKKITNNTMCIYPPINMGLWFWNMLGEDYKQIILTYSPEGAFRWGFINQFSFLLTNAKPIKRTKNVWHNKQFTGMGYFFKEDTFGHPGYTSEDITDSVISSFVSTGLVLDPYMGTGTTALACEKLGLNWLGIELNPDYCKIAKKRIDVYTRQLKLF